MSDEEVPPRELLVDAAPVPGDSSDGSGAAMAPIVFTVLAAGMLAKFVKPAAGLAALVFGILVVLLRRKPDLGRFVLRVDAGVLQIDREKAKKPLAALPLGDIVDVTLDRQAKPAGRGGAASAERVRLAIELKSGEPIFVPEDRLTPIEAQEWYGKVRVFLRKHGWAPAAEV